MLLLMTVINFFFGGSMTNIIPKKLKKGDHVRIIAPSRGAKIIGHDVRKIAEERFKKLGLSVSYGRYTTDDNWELLSWGLISVLSVCLKVVIIPLIIW